MRSKMSEIYNGNQWAHDILLVNKAGATEYITGRSSTLITHLYLNSKHAGFFFFFFATTDIY